MRKRHEGFRGASRRTASPFVLHCAALLAALMWMLPLCTHAASDAFSAPTAASSDPTPQHVVGHLCPELDHGPGDKHCRPSAEAFKAGAPSQPAPSPEGRDAVPVADVQGDPAPRGDPHLHEQTPGIYQLQVQRI